MRDAVWVLLTTEPAFHPIVEEYALQNQKQPVMPPADLVAEIQRVLVLGGEVKPFSTAQAVSESRLIVQ
mgnify:CR=1 FL=1